MAALLKAEVHWAKSKGEGFIDGEFVVWIMPTVDRGHYKIYTQDQNHNCYGSKQEAIASAFVRLMDLVRWRLLHGRKR